MCGIAGIIQPSNKIYSAEHINRMTGAIAHRGPDGEKFWQNHAGNVLFGHRHLSIIDLTPAAIQPMHLRDRFTIIHNGEIYNYIEVREELIKRGYKFFSNSDTEVILAAYSEWADECVDWFDGMFAFAIWDSKEERLFIARDRFGEKPIFFHHNNGILLFASEMKALWAAGVPRVPNKRMLFNYITIGYTDNPEQADETFFLKISSGCHPRLHSLILPRQIKLCLKSIGTWMRNTNRRYQTRMQLINFHFYSNSQ